MSRRGFIDIPDGQIHYRSGGSGKPLLLLHQTPRSSDEYLEMIPILAKQFRVLAMDTIGYGDSYKPEKKCSIEDYSKGVIDFLDALGIQRTCVVGHHTGAVIAFELAASFPDRVERLVLSACLYLDDAKREQIRKRPAFDRIELKEDGSHFLDLWKGRMGFYPKERPDLLTRFVVDAIKAGEKKVEDGHKAVYEYQMESKFKQISCPTLIMCGTADPFAHPDMYKLAQSIKGSLTTEVPDGTVAIMDQMPEEVCKIILPFLVGEDQGNSK